MEEKKKEQKALAEKVLLEDGFDRIELVAGTDSAFTGKKIISGVVVMKHGKSVETTHLEKEVVLPYRPTFLMFTEGPAMVEAVNKVHPPHLLFVDGHGIAHPRKAGLACYVGVSTDIPTIGIAKNVLVGDYVTPNKPGETNPLEFAGEQVGWVYKQNEFFAPIFISPGHKISLDSCLELTKEYLEEHKLPEPLFQAHRYVNQVKKDVENSGKG